jgi:cyclic beta-1,2-glucan synthetase
MGDGERAFELFQLLNPLERTRTPAGVATYRAEPYVVAADVYSQDRHVGRGGWTWYTGSAGWMYRVGVESILGLTLHRGALRLDPCIPSGWKQYEVTYRTAAAEFRIVVENPEGVCRGVRRIEVDGVECPDLLISLAGANGVHQVQVLLGT